jgi:Flp pilus assembly protein TadD
MNAQHVRLCAALAALLVAAGMEPEAMAGIKPEAMAGIKPEAMAAKGADIGAPTGTETADGKALTLEFIDKAITEGRLKSAGELILRARARYAGPELTLREAELMLAGGATTEAATAFQQLEGDPIVGARALAGRGIAAIRAGQDAAAETLLAAAVVRDPSLARAWSARGVLADRRRDWAAADGFYTQALKAAPDSAAFLNNRGYSRLLQGRHADAEEDLVRAVKLDPALKAAQTNLTLAKAMQGRYAEAFASRDRDELARDLNTVGVAAMLRGDNRIAQSYFTRAIEMNGRFDKTAAANLAYLKAIDPALDSEAKVERR